MRVNKQKHFYSHLIPIDEMLIELGKTDMSSQEKMQLITIVEQSMHYTVIDIVLNNLPEEKKHHFLAHVHSSNHHATWEFLSKRTKDIENKITKSVEKLKKELLQDIAEVKKQSKKNI